jgi:hypothetical protein
MAVARHVRDDDRGVLVERRLHDLRAGRGRGGERDGTDDPYYYSRKLAPTAHLRHFSYVHTWIPLSFTDLH